MSIEINVTLNGAQNLSEYMKKADFDPDGNFIPESAEKLDDGTNEVTAAQAKDAVDKAHVAATAGAGISVAGQVITNSDRGSTAVSTHEAAVDPHTQYQKESEKGQANGYASLGSDSKIPAEQLPDVTITDTFVVASEVAMLALSAQLGDVAVRTDLNKSFILKTAGASVLANWQELLTPTDSVLSVAGKTGAVSLEKADVGLGNADNTSDVNKPVSTAQQTALDLKKDIKRKKVTVIETFQVDDWSLVAGGNGAKSIDTVDFVAGVQSLKLVTAGSGTGMSDYLSKDIAFSMNTEKKQAYLEFDIKVTDAHNISRLYVHLYSSIALNQYRYALIEATGTKMLPDGEWITVKVPAHSFDNYSSGMNDVTIGWDFERIRIRMSDAGTPVTFRFNGIRMVEIEKRAIVLMSFDDSNKSTFTRALPIMTKYGIKGTSFNIKENVGLSASYMTVADLLVLEGMGWTNGLHGQSPTEDGWDNLTEEQLVDYYTRSINFWKKNNLYSGLDTVAYPNGNFGKSRSSYIYRVTKKFCRVARVTSNAIVDPTDYPSDPLLLHSGDNFYFRDATSPASIIADLDRLAEYGGVAALVGHDITTGASSGNAYNVTDFETVVAHIASLVAQGVLETMTYAEYRDIIVGKREIEYMPPSPSYIGEPMAVGTSDTVQSSNRSWFSEALVTVPLKVSNIRVNINVQSGNICGGIYDQYGTLIATTGSIACPATGDQNLALTSPVILEKGRYYLAFAADNVTMKLRTCATSRLAGIYYKDTNFPLASLAGRVDAELQSGARPFAIVGI